MSRVGEVESAEAFFMGGPDRRGGSRLRRALHRSTASATRPTGRTASTTAGDLARARREHAGRHGGGGRWRDAAAATEAHLERVREEPCIDWWEEREGVHAATLACIAAGLGDDLDLSRAEERLDGSLLVLPFLGFGPVDVTALVGRGGGLDRHLDDTYYGGGEWLLLTAMLGLAEPEHGEECLEWIAAHAAPDGGLPEQSHYHLLHPDQYEHLGRQEGAAALAAFWSHAMFLTFDDKLHRAELPARLQPIARRRSGPSRGPGTSRSRSGSTPGSSRSCAGHRHVVRFVEYDGALGPKLYALKGCRSLARREYRLLRALAADETPVVEAVGVSPPAAPTSTRSG